MMRRTSIPDNFYSMLFERSFCIVMTNKWENFFCELLFESFLIKYIHRNMLGREREIHISVSTHKWNIIVALLFISREICRSYITDIPNNDCIHNFIHKSISRICVLITWAKLRIVHKLYVSTISLPS